VARDYHGFLVLTRVGNDIVNGKLKCPGLREVKMSGC